MVKEICAKEMMLILLTIAIASNSVSSQSYCDEPLVLECVDSVVVCVENASVHLINWDACRCNVGYYQKDYGPG